MGDTMHKVRLSDAGDTPTLECVALGAPWNGYERPIATFDQVAEWVYQMKRNDRHCSLGEVKATRRGLVIENLDYDREFDDEFPPAGKVDGVTVYDLSGWVWIPADE